MSTLYRFLLISILTVFCLCSATMSASAQSLSIPSLADFPVDTDVFNHPSESLDAPLEIKERSENKKYTIALTDTATDNYFEVYALHFDNIDYAPKLFEAFEKALHNRFQNPKSEGLTTEYTLVDGNKRTVTRHIIFEYQDNQNKQLIYVEEIAFAVGSMAIALIGYYPKDNIEEGSKILENILIKMVDKPTEH